ncbi:MAG: VCBS repeat-containing protein [Planctomycetes bacterium]|nr:VCBS repeat-containing protein [Planctomycetota bacterium]
MATPSWQRALYRIAARRAAKRRASARSSAPVAAPEPLEGRQLLAADPPLRVGMNLENIVDWSPAWVFKDAFQASRGWITHAVDAATGGIAAWDVGESHPLAVDAEGVPTGLATWSEGGRTLRQAAGTLLFRDIAGGHPAGRYRAEWDGSGSVRFDFDASVVATGRTADGRSFADLLVTPTDAGIHVVIDRTDPADPVRGLHVWMPDWQGQSFAGQRWRPGDPGTPFHPLFLERLKPFSTLRFMALQETNGSTILSWADRRTADAVRQGSGPGGSASEPAVNGMALEYMVQLANDLDADAWFNMPHAADDDFVRRFATYVHDCLEPGRRVFVEWSNEIWNFAWGFEGSRWVDAQTRLPGNEGLSHWEVAGREARRDMEIWSGVFADAPGRLSRVAAGWSANDWVSNEIATAMAGSFDVIAIAPYMQPTLEQRAGYSAATGVEQVLADTRSSIARMVAEVGRHRQIAADWSARLGRPIQVVAYEGGPHLDGRGAPYQAAFNAAAADRRMGDLTRDYLRALDGAGLDLYLHFQLTASPYAGSFGDFGTLHRMDEAPATAWRYAAVVAAADGSLFAPPAPAVRPAIDFDGDGLGDLVWRNAATGLFTARLLDAAGSVKATRVLGAGTHWEIATVGDFDGDRVSDLAWRHLASGTTVVWLLRGDGSVRTSAPVGGDLAWRIETSDDYDGDGRDDLVWRHAATGATTMALMDGLAVRKSRALGGDPVTRLVATSGRYDADGDGRADLVWRDARTGATRLWRMNGTDVVARANLGGDLRWEVAATGDFDGDGRGDIVWRDAATGTAVMRLMDGGRVVAARTIRAAGSQSVVATLVRDGRSALVWRESASGATVAWTVQGTTVTGSFPLGGDGVRAVWRRPGRTVG